jgi:hypothetical protein
MNRKPDAITCALLEDLEADRHYRTGEKHYWLTPPDLYAHLDAEFAFDHAPCPEHHNALVPDARWGLRNYVNPPFNRKDAPHGGPAAFVRKAIAERDRTGAKSIFILPLPWSLGLLMSAGAEIRYAGPVQWLDTATRQPCPRKAPQALAILRPLTTP